MTNEVDVRLRQLGANFPTYDPILGRITRVTENEGGSVFQLGLVLCVGAFTFRGVPGSPIRMTTNLDSEVARGIRIIKRGYDEEGKTVDGLDELIEAVEAGWFSKPVREFDEEAVAFWNELEKRQIKLEDVALLPDDLVTRGVHATAHSRGITLTEAQVLGPNANEWESIGVVRIALHQVGAWWTFPLADPADVEEKTG